MRACERWLGHGSALDFHLEFLDGGVLHAQSNWPTSVFDASKFGGLFFHRPFRDRLHGLHCYTHLAHLLCFLLSKILTFFLHRNYRVGQLRPDAYRRSPILGVLWRHTVLCNRVCASSSCFRAGSGQCCCKKQRSSQRFIARHTICPRLSEAASLFPWYGGRCSAAMDCLTVSSTRYFTLRSISRGSEEKKQRSGRSLSLRFGNMVLPC